MSSTDRSIDSTLHVTFQFHCAFVRSPDRRRTDVLLSPGPEAHANGDAHEGSSTATNGHNGHDDGEAAAPHRMQHIASLRIPQECVVDKHQGTPQKTVRLNGLERETVIDKTWRLEGFDVAIDVGNESRRTNAPPASVGFGTTDRNGSPFVIADFAALAGASAKIDEACTKDGDEFPGFLKKGARVRVWGGTLQCGIPQGALRTRQWDLGLGQPVGLSDRMEYRKPLDGGQVVLRFTKFETGEESTVRLQPDASGVVRLTISNDPFADDLAAGSRQTDPCGQLRHFASYSLLLFPAGDDKSARLRAPVPLPIESGNGPLIVTEGNSVCCPCGDGGPPPEP